MPAMREREKRVIPNGTFGLGGPTEAPEWHVNCPGVRAFEAVFNDLCTLCQDGMVCVILTYPKGRGHLLFPFSTLGRWNSTLPGPVIGLFPADQESCPLWHAS